MPRTRSLEERVEGLESALADLRQEIENVYVVVSAESVHRMHDKGFTPRQIAAALGRPVAYVKRTLEH